MIIFLNSFQQSGFKIYPSSEVMLASLQQSKSDKNAKKIICTCA